MPKPRHHHVGGTVTHTPLPPAAPAANLPPTMPTASSCAASPQRSAAAWAWFEHGGSSACITPCKAEGLIAAKRSAQGGPSGRRPSRFRQEVLRRTTVILRRRSFGLSEFDDKAAVDRGRRRHSFHDYDGLPPPSVRAFSSSAMTSTAQKSWSFRLQYGAGAKKGEEEDERARQKDQTRSSLLDDSEIEAVFLQLGRHLRTRSEGSAGSAGKLKQQHLEPAPASKSIHNHKISPGKQHCETGDDHVLHRLLRLRSKILGSNRSSSSTIPAFCSSISTADCIIDHRQPKQLAGSGNTSTALTMMTHLRPQYSKLLDVVEPRTTSTQHRQVLHQHVHHIHHHHYHHHLRGASLDPDRKGDVRSLLASQVKLNRIS